MKHYFILFYFVNSVAAMAQTNGARKSPDLNVGLGIIYPFDKTQDTSGGEEADPISPTLTVNGSWNVYRSISFSPLIGYTKYTNNTKDSFGGNYSIESFYFLYDFLMPIFSINNLDFRYGLGAVQKRINGSGGNVTIPNGNSTTIAFKPNVSKATSTLTLNLGLDYRFNKKGTTIKDQGLRLEFLVLQPLDKVKRMFSSSLNYVLFF